MMYALRIALILLLSFCLVRCAVQTTPQGGPKDVDPPVLVKSFPKNKQTNFKGKIVELTFNEQVKLNNASEEIIITPSPGKVIDFNAKQNKITIEPKENWKENTTYSISFREGVQDVTENNPADTLHLAFSTGPGIDSLTLYGRIRNGITEEIPQKVTVAIYQSDTTDILKHAAIYFTKTDKGGHFKIENLKSGKYFVYAFDDRNKNLKVESTTEKFGFKSEPIILEGKKIDSIIFAIAKADSRPIKINSIRRTEKTTRVTFNKAIVHYKAESNTTTQPINSFGDTKSEIIFFNPSTKSDSLKINLFARDSIDLSLDTTFYIKQSEIRAIKENFKVNISEPIITLETGIFNLKAFFTKPISKIDTDSIYIKIDSINIVRIEENEIQTNNTEKTIHIEKKIDKKLFSKEKITPQLFIGKGFIISYENDTSKIEGKPIKILSVEKTATLEIQIKTNQTNLITQLLSESGTVIESIKDLKNYTFKNLDPLTYRIRVIVDKNNNGQWDTTNIHTRTEAEPVYYYKSPEGNSAIKTRENSDIGPLILTF